MNERDDEINEILQGVENFIRHRPVVAPIDQKVDHDGTAENIVNPEIEKFLYKFVQPHLISIDENNTRPDEIAQVVRRDFEERKNERVQILRTEGAHGLAGEISKLQLHDVTEKLDNDMDACERRLADFAQSSMEYKSIERLIRKMNILQVAVDKAIDIS